MVPYSTGSTGRVTEHLTIKVCIAVPKELKSKCKEFEPFELKANNDSIEYHRTRIQYRRSQNH